MISNVLPIIASIVIAYLFGSVNSAIIICKVFGFHDPRTTGSENPGATNVLRIAGKKYAILTLVFDLLKGVLAVCVARSMNIDGVFLSLVGVAVILGHAYPIFFKFKGGKGVATSAGVIFALSPLLGLAAICTWILCAVFSRISSLSAISAAVATPFYAALISLYSFIPGLAVISIFVLFRHISNIKRILDGTESLIGEAKKEIFVENTKSQRKPICGVDKIDQSIFRSYDIRGVVGETITEDVVRTIGQAIGSEALDLNEKSIIIARDGRLSGPILLKALCEGILQSGCNVIDIGAVPTPALYYATNALGVRSGVALTGSHNPPHYNGLKIVLAGKTLAEKEITALYDRIASSRLSWGQGKLSSVNILDKYISRITKNIKLERTLRIGIDCGNGIGAITAPEIFEQLGCEVHQLYCNVDGNFPNHPADPSVPKNLDDLIQLVKDKNLDVGLAFDGDADRLGVVTNLGRIINPDRQLMLFAIDVLKRQPNSMIVFDVKCSQLLSNVIREHGGIPVMWKTGHSLIKAKMQEQKDIALGGEMSGHLFIKERWYGFDDGVYAGARLLELLSQSEDTLEEIFDELPDSINTPEIKIPVLESEKFGFMKDFQENTKFKGANISKIDGLRADFKYGFGLIRASNTSPYLIARFEANTQKNLEKIMGLFKDQLLKINPKLDVSF